MPRETRYLTVPVPAGIDRSSAKAAVATVQARQLEHVDTWSAPGKAIRGRGVAASRDVAASSGTVISAGIFRRRDCRQVLVDASAAGVWRGHFGGLNSRGGGMCAGPLPDWPDLAEGAVYVSAQVEAGVTIYPNAVAGKTYEIEARGLWSRDADLATYLRNENGEAETIGGAGGTFAGFYVGKFSVKPPGGSWTEIGSRGRVLATSSGAILGVFPDYAGLFGDNVGQVAVQVREL